LNTRCENELAALWLHLFFEITMVSGWVIRVSAPSSRGHTTWYAAVSDAVEACQKVKEAAQPAPNQVVKVIRQLSEEQITALEFKLGDVRQR